MEKNNNPDQILRQALVLVPKIGATRQALGNVLIKRHEEILALFVGMVADVAVFLDGPAGVAKTMTAELFVDAIKGATHYTQLVPGVATPDDMFVEGVTIEETPTPSGGKVVKINKTLGRAATATGVILDEIWKAEDNPSVLNALLDLLLSKGIRHEGQKHADKAYLVVAISNEEPDPNGKYMAHWARCVLRLFVEPLEGNDLDRMFAAQIDFEINGRGMIQPANPLTVADVHFLQSARAHVTVPQDVQDTVKQIIQDLFDKDADGFGWLKTDNRRYGLILRSLQAHALINGRSTVGKQDLAILEWMLWNTPEQIEEVQKVLVKYVRTPAKDAREIIDTLLASGGAVETAFKAGQPTKESTKAMQRAREIIERQLPELASQAAGTADESQILGWLSALKIFLGKFGQRIAGLDTGSWEESVKDFS